jgi:hypothetical protein
MIMRCESVHTKGLRCDRTAGHDGHHEAANVDDHSWAVWQDSPGIPPGQAAGERPVAARDAEEEKEPGPGDGVTSPARVSDDLLSSGEWMFLRGDFFQEANGIEAPPSTWLPPGASDPEPGDPSVEDDGAEPAGRWSGPDTFEPIEQAIRDGAPEHDERAEACVGRVRARLFGKDGGT